MQVDEKKLQELIENYKNHFRERFSKEKFKWQAIKIFQDNFDLAAKDITAMLKKSLPEKENGVLFSSNNYYPLRMLTSFSEYEALTVKAMFENLYDESKDLEERIDAFGKEAEALLKYFPNASYSYQNNHAISLYLEYRYPDKYFMYKDKENIEVAKMLGVDIECKGENNKKTKKYLKYLELCKQVLKYMKKDKELLELVDSSLDDTCYKNDDYHMLVSDFLFASATKEKEKEKEVNNRCWIYAPGENAVNWDDNIKKGIMSLDFTLQDITNLSKKAIKKLLQSSKNSESEETNNSLALYEFANKMQVGDIVIAKKGQKCLIGYGIVKSDYYYNKNEKSFRHQRQVEWQKVGEWPVTDLLVMKALTDISEDKYKDYAQKLLNIMNNDDKEYTKLDFEEDVYHEDYETILDLLADKKNIILEGPPGVGKTHIAKRLAYLMMGKKDKSRIKVVEFHQSYSYEDFILGYKPTADGGFTLRKGIFYKLCEDAIAHSHEENNKFFLVIDEINRGNLSKIFGELLMLIENDKRGKEQVTLAYQKDGEEIEFTVPENLYIIGTMNTADRSLTIFDYALRRRFAFVDLKPEFDSKGFKKYQAEINNPYFDEVIRRVKDLNEVIKEEKTYLGPDYMIGHSYFCNLKDTSNIEKKLNYIIENEIIPLLKVYLMDNEELLAKLIKIINPGNE